MYTSFVIYKNKTSIRGRKKTFNKSVPYSKHWVLLWYLTFTAFEVYIIMLKLHKLPRSQSYYMKRLEFHPVLSFPGCHVRHNFSFQGKIIKICKDDWLKTVMDQAIGWTMHFSLFILCVNYGKGRSREIPFQSTFKTHFFVLPAQFFANYFI